MSNVRRNSRLVLAGLFILGMAAGGLNALWHAAASELETLEAIPGSHLKRLVLSSTVVKRLAIETGVIRKEKVSRWLMVSGEVEAVEVRGLRAIDVEDTASTTAADDTITPVRVRVPLLDKPEELAGRAIAIVSLGGGRNDGDDRGDTVDDADEPGDISDTGEEEVPAVIVLPIGSQYGKVRFLAKPINDESDGDNDGTYFAVDNAESSLQPGQRVVVRIAQPDSGTLQKVVPYSAIIYDTQGNTWVYTSPEPFVFIRHAVSVEHVDDGLAILTDGPAVGTRVVTVGAAELMGIEQNIGY